MASRAVRLHFPQKRWHKASVGNTELVLGRIWNRTITARHPKKSTPVWKLVSNFSVNCHISWLYQWKLAMVPEFLLFLSLPENIKCRSFPTEAWSFLLSIGNMPRIQKGIIFQMRSTTRYWLFRIDKLLSFPIHNRNKHAHSWVFACWTIKTTVAPWISSPSVLFSCLLPWLVSEVSIEGTSILSFTSLYNTVLPGHISFGFQLVISLYPEA